MLCKMTHASTTVQHCTPEHLNVSGSTSTILSITQNYFQELCELYLADSEKPLLAVVCGLTEYGFINYGSAGYAGSLRITKYMLMMTFIVQ